MRSACEPKVVMSPAEDKKVDERLQMSKKGMDRLEVMQRLAERRMRQKEAAEGLGLNIR